MATKKMSWDTCAYEVLVNSFAGYYLGEIIPPEKVVETIFSKENVQSRIAMGAIRPIDPASLKKNDVTEDVESVEPPESEGADGTVPGSAPGATILTEDDVSGMTADQLRAAGVNLPQKVAEPPTV